MRRVLIVSPDTEHARGLAAELSDKGFLCSVASYDERGEWQLPERPTDLALVELDGASSDSNIWGLPSRIRNEWHSPVIALVSKTSLGYLDSSDEVDDFVVEPWDSAEVATRIKRTIGNGVDGASELIRCGDLVIDTAKFEVAVSGRPIELTFREYELLSFLASNRGRVFTREALLNKVWGYDFYGGDRTVDVHVRRLRSKLEDANHTFIETVRNVGYRFIEDGKEC
jgi:DNA-binding response OmpR family regulator